MFERAAADHPAQEPAGKVRAASIAKRMMTSAAKRPSAIATRDAAVASSICQGWIRVTLERR
jgi:hypothetical protein